MTPSQNIWESFDKEFFIIPQSLLPQGEAQEKIKAFFHQKFKEMFEEIERKSFKDENYPAFDLEGWTGDANAFSEICGEQEWEMEVIGNIYENSYLLDNKES